MKHIPNTITLLNLAAGFLSVLMAFENQLQFAAILILVAALLDFLDGFLARILNAMSDLGKQLDSLSDLISFGMAPAVLAYKLLEFQMRLSGGINSFTDAPLGMRILLLSPLMLLLCSAIRLASFNLQEKSKDFKGLATPASGIFFAGITLAVLSQPSSSLTSFIMQSATLIACIVIISLLMILPLPMFSLKFSGYGWKGNGIRYIFLAISGILLIILHEIALPVIIFVYLLASIVQHLTSTLLK